MILNPWKVFPILEMLIFGRRFLAGGGITSLRLMPELSWDNGKGFRAKDDFWASDAMSITS